MELLNIREHSSKYKTHTEIETALAFHAIHKFLKENNRFELFEYIKALRITEKNISLIVSSSIAKNEFSLIKEPLGECIQTTLKKNYNSHTRNFKIL